MTRSMVRYSEPYSLYSNFFFVVPLLIAVYYHDYLGVLLSGGLCFFSFLYHFRKPVGSAAFRLASEKLSHGFPVTLYFLDVFFALVLISYNLLLFSYNGFGSLFWVACLFVGIGFFFFFKPFHSRYDFCHGVWHFCSAVITVLAFLSNS